MKRKRIVLNLKPVVGRILAKTIPEPNTGCLLFTGCHNSKGYGQVGIGARYLGNRKVVYTHRTIYEAFRGPIPANLMVLHKCDTRCCVNIDHLFLGTAKENMDDMKAKGRWRSNQGLPQKKIVA